MAKILTQKLWEKISAVKLPTAAQIGALAAIFALCAFALSIFALIKVTSIKIAITKSTNSSKSTDSSSSESPSSEYDSTTIKSLTKIPNVSLLPITVKMNYSVSIPYNAAFLYLNASMNGSANPCEEFYEFACGRYGDANARDRYATNNFLITDLAMKSSHNSNSKAVKAFTDFYALCRKTLSDPKKSSALDAFLRRKMENLAKYTSLNSTIFAKDTVTQLPNGSTLAKVIAYLAVTAGIHVFVTSDVMFSRYATGKKEFFFDEGTLARPTSFYEPNGWEDRRQAYYDDCYRLLESYANSTNVPFQPIVLSAKLNAIIDLEVRMAREFMRRDSKRPSPENFPIGTSINRAFSDYKFVDWTVLIEEIRMLADVPIEENIYKMSVYFMDSITRLSSHFINGAAEFAPDTVVNYFFFRVLSANHDEFTADVGSNCASRAIHYLPYAAARFYADLRFASAEERRATKSGMERLVRYVERGFLALLNDADRLAKWKMKYIRFTTSFELLLNLTFSDFVLNSTQLDNLHANLHLDASKDFYFDAIEKLIVFNNHLKYSLMNLPVDGTQLYQPATDVAFHHRFSPNSINISEEIFSEPFFSAKWPASVRLGSWGSVIGGELSAEFDKIDEYLWPQHSELLECVAEQSAKIDALDVSNISTLNEIIADDAGAQSAHRALNRYLADYGKEGWPKHSQFSPLTSEQLFFVSFARMRCEATAEARQKARQRVEAPLRNFPAFRDAFDCRLGSAMAPDEPCLL